MIFSSLIQAFEENKDPEHAIKMKAYMKNRFEFYGVKSPLRKELMKNWKRNNKFEFSEILLEELLILFQHPKRELNYIAIDLMIPLLKKNAQNNHQDYITQLIITRSWWDSVDAIASNILGNYLSQFPEKTYQLVEDYSQSNSIWLKRSTLIFQLKYKEKTDRDLLFAQCLLFKDEKEFFIQKAIGWSLRQYAKYNPAEVYDFIDGNQFSNLVNKEAQKYRV